MGSPMSSVDLQDRPRKTGAMSRLVSGVWLIATLLIVHGLVPPGGLSSSGQAVPRIAAMGGISADERTSSPSLKPRASSAWNLTEGRHHAPKREFPPERDPPSALGPIPATAPKPTSLERPQRLAQEQRQPSAVHAFEARGPPNIA